MGTSSRSLLVLFVALALAACSNGAFYAGAIGGESSSPTPPLSLLWQQKMDAAPLGSALEAGRLVLQLSTAATLYAYDRQNGKRVGKRGYDGEVCAAPTLAGDLVLVSTLGDDAAVVAWDRRAQKERWRYAGTYCRRAVVSADTAYITGEGGALRALDLHSGEELWRQHLKVRVRVAPTVSDELLLLGDGKGILHALSRFDGEEVWKKDLDSGVRTTVLAEGEWLWVGTAAGRIVALNAKSGELQWQTELAALPAEHLALTAGVVAIGAADRHLYGLDRQSGEVVWAFATEGAMRSSPAGAAGVFYCASSDEHLYAIEAENGKMIWKFRLEGPAIEPVALMDGVVAVATEKKVLYVFGRR